MLDHSVQAKPNAAKAAQTINKHKSDIAAIYKNSKTQVAQAISDLLSRLGRPISGKGDLQGLLNSYSALIKIAPEFGPTGHKHGAHSTAQSGGVGGISPSNGAIPSPQEIVSTIQSLLADGVNSFDEIGEIVRLVGMAQGALPPELIGKIKQDIKSFLQQALGSAGSSPQEAIHLLNQIKSMGGGSQVQDLIKAVEEMIKDFLANHEEQTRGDMLGHISNVASDTIESNLNDTLDAMAETLQPLKAGESSQL